ncbi:MAG: hypothetical protein QNJ74_11695 [Trichodesmium sp. MO_231.B1]|nr:hypothetical protein [Trichodesmium sp. MO_231.B1]
MVGIVIVQRVRGVWEVWESEKKLKNIYLRHYNAGLPKITAPYNLVK